MRKPWKAVYFGGDEADEAFAVYDEHGADGLVRWVSREGFNGDELAVEPWGEGDRIERVRLYAREYVVARHPGRLYISVNWRQVRDNASKVDVHVDVDSHNANPPGKPFSDNPPGVEIYANILEIRAEKADGRLYKHTFKRGSKIIGMADGSLRIVSGKGNNLWENFTTDGRGNRK